MTILDYGIIIICAISLLVGLMRGFVREVLSVVTWVAAIWLGLNYYSEVGEFFKGAIGNELFRNVAGFAAIFFVVIIVCSLVSYLINKLVTKTGIKGTDRVLGAVFGILRAVLIVVILLLVGQSVNYQETDNWKNSQFVKHFEPMVETANSLLPAGLKVDGINKVAGKLVESQLQLGDTGQSEQNVLLPKKLVEPESEVQEPMIQESVEQESVEQESVEQQTVEQE